MDRETAGRLQRAYCSTARFRDCPLFRQLEHDLAMSGLQPALQPAA
jgi:hypothetical protein